MMSQQFIFDTSTQKGYDFCMVGVAILYLIRGIKLKLLI